MTSYINNHLQLTKEALQSITKDDTYVSRYQRIETVLADIYGNVQHEARGGKTTYVYKFRYDISSGQEEKFIAELMKKIAAEFIGCKIDYVETKGYDGTIIERVIVIDWS